MELCCILTEQLKCVSNLDGKSKAVLQSFWIIRLRFQGDQVLVLKFRVVSRDTYDKNIRVTSIVITNYL